MKRGLLTVALALAAALICGVPAAAMPQPQAYEQGALSGICADGKDLLVTDVYNKTVWRVTGDEAVRAAGKSGVRDVNGTPIGGYADGEPQEALFREPWAVAPFARGFAVTDAEANVVRWFDGTAVRTLAGSGEAGSQNAAGATASFHRPTGLALGPDGELYVADTGNGAIRCISGKGEVSTWSSGLSEPTGLCWADGALYVAETGAHCISRISRGERVVVAGTEGTAGYRDGPAGHSLLRAPLGVTVGSDGVIYIADTGNSAVRRLRDGRVTTLASAQRTPEALARPRGLLLRDGDLLVTDALAGRVLELPLAAPVYSDVAAGSSYAWAVTEATERGLCVGTGGDRFSPDLPVTRAMLATLLGRLYCSANGDEVIDGAPRFRDVAAGSIYEAGINWCAEQGFMPGTDDGLFQPDRAVTREALMTVLHRYAAANGYPAAANGDLSRFTDAASISSYAREALSWAAGTGLIQNNGGQLSPSAPVTRAQAADILVRFMDLIGA